MNKGHRLIVIDTETTGLTLHEHAPLHKQPKIIEFGAIILEHGACVEELALLINPREALTEEIQKITGLTDADLRNQMLFHECVPQLTKLFQTCDHVMAHNLPFDRAMVMNELQRANCRDRFPWPAKETCVVGLYKEMWGYNPKLKDVYEHVMGKPLQQTHRALNDVKALVEIIQEEELWQLG